MPSQACTLATTFWGLHPHDDKVYIYIYIYFLLMTIYIYILYIYILSFTDKLLCCITTLPCSLIRETLRSRITLSLRQVDDIPPSQAGDWGNIAYVLTFVCLHFALSDTELFTSFEDLCITRVAIPSFAQVLNLLERSIYIFITWSTFNDNLTNEQLPSPAYLTNNFYSAQQL